MRELRKSCDWIWNVIVICVNFLIGALILVTAEVCKDSQTNKQIERFYIMFDNIQR